MRRPTRVPCRARHWAPGSALGTGLGTGHRARHWTPGSAGPWHRPEAILGSPVSMGATVREFARFLARRKRYWLLPMALTLLVLGILAVLTEGSAVAPFIYTLF